MDLKNKKIFLIVTNDLSTDQRMHRICGTLAAAGAEVYLVGRRTPWMIPLPDLPFYTIRLQIPLQKGFLFYALFNIRIFFFLLFKKADIIVSNDLDTIAACRTVAALRRKILVYDSHELFTEVPELINRRFVQRFWLAVERLLLPGIKYCYTVNHSLARYYHDKYGIKMEVIRNVPLAASPDIQTHKPFPVEPGKKIILYQGSVNMGRGLELAMDAISSLPGFVLVIAGIGDIMDKLRQKAENMHLGDRVIFMGRLSPHELRYYTSQATIGISVEEPAGLNYYYSSPNKVYDYIQARVPVLVSPFPEMKALIEKWKIGEMLHERTVECFIKQIKEILAEGQKQNRLKEGLEEAARELCWEKEQKSLLDFYAHIC